MRNVSISGTGSGRTTIKVTLSNKEIFKISTHGLPNDSVYHNRTRTRTSIVSLRSSDELKCDEFRLGPGATPIIFNPWSATWDVSSTWNFGRSIGRRTFHATTTFTRHHEVAGYGRRCIEFINDVKPSLVITQASRGRSESISDVYHQEGKYYSPSFHCFCSHVDRVARSITLTSNLTVTYFSLCTSRTGRAPW